MAVWKTIATLTWQFEGDDEHKMASEFAKTCLASIVDCCPAGEIFSDFNVCMSLVKLKSKHKMIHIQEFNFKDVFPFITKNESRKDYVVGDITYSVKMNSQRYHLFNQQKSCVVCGLTGTKLILDVDFKNQSPHFNMYAIENDRLVLMTKDHIVPKSKGGRDIISNYRTMCSTCNTVRANFDLTLDQIKYLREIYVSNSDFLLPADLRKTINDARIKFAEGNKI